MTGTRTLTVAVLVTGALTAVLVAWFGAGWRAAGRERDALTARARTEADVAAAEAAAGVVTRLEELRATESQRPYFHYQNLFHDPRGASEGRSVVPSATAVTSWPSPDKRSTRPSRRPASSSTRRILMLGACHPARPAV